MAARMRGSGGGAAYAVSLVLFVFLFLVSTILAIVFKTQVDKALVEAKEATTKYKDLIKRAEEGRPDITEMRRNQSAGSVVGQLLMENERLKHVINASPNASVEAVENNLASIGINVSEGETLVAAIRRMDAERQALEGAVETYNRDLEQLRRRVPEFERQMAEHGTAYKKAVDGLRGDVDSLQKDFTSFQSQADGQRTTLEGQLGSLRARMHANVNELRNNVEVKDQQLAVQKQRLEDLKRYLTRAGEGAGADPTRESDGKVSSILSEENLVYITRGARDHVQLGMTFEVFDPSVGVFVDEVGDLRGKATVEVIELSDSAALARIVRSERHSVVSEGDHIANLVYDPNVQYTFYIFGKFDIDSTGQPTTTDRRRLESMVRHWGGGLAESLTYSTDFLVLGDEPELPSPLSRDVIDPKVIEQHAAQMRRYREYQGLIGEAKALSIPILNQNRFLSLVGYYRR